MNLRRLVVIFSLLLCLAAPLRADDRVQSQISAAASNAVDKLAEDVLDEKIGVDLTIADFVHDTGSIDKLMDLLRQAEQIGGPRWLDDQTCQVKLAVEGPRVLEMLRQTAELNGNKTPIPAQALVKRLKDWNQRTFVATGTAISLKAAQQLPPPTQSAWDSIPEAARQQAVVAAADNAAAKALDELKSVDYQPGKPLSQALSNQAVEQKLQGYFKDRPVTAVHFSNDGSVETTLSIGQDELVAALVDALQAGSIDLSKDADQLQQLRVRLANRSNTVTGRAKASEAVQPRIAAASMLPNFPPEWVKNPITVAGKAPPAPSRLKTARQAEDQALGSLRSQLESLPLNGGRSIGDWAKQDGAVRRVLDEMIVRAKVTKIEYAPDGSAAVKVTVDPRDLWDELRELP